MAHEKNPAAVALGRLGGKGQFLLRLCWNFRNCLNRNLCDFLIGFYFFIGHINLLALEYRPGPLMNWNTLCNLLGLWCCRLFVFL